jgi:hypothetical protein
MQRTRWMSILRVAGVMAVVVILLAQPSDRAQPGRPLSWLPFGTLQISLWWLVLSVPLIVHGLLHLTGLAAPFTRLNLGFAERPCILARAATPHSAVGRVFCPAWLAASLLLVSSGVGLLFGRDWWAGLAVAGALVSLALVLTWWKAVPRGAKVGAAFNLLVLLAAVQAMPVNIA